MKKTLYIILATIPAIISLGSCNTKSEEPVESDYVVDIENPSLKLADADFHSLTFTWDDIAGARQYGYAFTLGSTLIADGVTLENTLTFSGLTEGTEYTLTINAFAPLGETSKRFSVKASTVAYKQLDAPQPVVEISGTNTIISWEAIEGAESYKYNYQGKRISGEGETEETSVAINRLPKGEYTFTIQALSETEGYINSEITEITFTR